jgi:hypothetical protein
MKHLIQIKNSTFNVSDSVIREIAKNNLKFQLIEQNGKQIHLLSDCCISFFTAVSPESPKHFFIKIGNSAKLRVNKAFFEFIVLHSKQNLHEKTQSEISASCVEVSSSNVEIKEQDSIVKPKK